LTPRITVGLPVYKGADLIPKCLDCLQRQTFRDFEVIISVDGNDLETAAACRPFLMDPRFRMVVHPERLDWVGNFNWLLQQDLQEFFCYRQHDDTTAPEFFEVLLLAAEMEPNAAAVYCDCQYSGGRDDIESAPSIEGESLYRMVRYMEYVPSSAAPLRGLIRRAAIRHAGLVRSDEFRAPLEEFVWLAKLLRWGNFRRVAKPLYYRLDHPRSFTSAWFSSPEDRKRAALTRLFTGLLEVAVPLCRTPEQRRFFQQFILNRIVDCFYWWSFNEPNSAEKIFADCLERLRLEGNTHLLRREELSPILQELKLRPDIKVLEQSRIRRFIYRMHQRSRMGRAIYPTSRMRRVIYQLRYPLETLRNKISSLLLPSRGSGAAERKRDASRPIQSD
jgi:glycosyltransferase involved in cell wall biosynthesis